MKKVLSQTCGVNDATLEGAGWRCWHPAQVRDLRAYWYPFGKGFGSIRFGVV